MTSKQNCLWSAAFEHDWLHAKSFQYTACVCCFNYAKQRFQVNFQYGYETISKCTLNRIQKTKGGQRWKSVKYNSQSVSHWGSLSYRWWPGWKSKPRCTRGHCHSEWSCWWTGCKYCWCSRHSCSYPSPSLRFQTPTQKWSLNHLGPGETSGKIQRGNRRNSITIKL